MKIKFELIFASFSEPTSDLDLVDEEDGNGSLTLTEIKLDDSV